MELITIAGKSFSVKDYCCVNSGNFFERIPGEQYIKKETPSLWLYVNVTDCCNASCPFCANNSCAKKNGVIDPEKLEAAVKMVLPYISGISFTGGEPMLYTEILNEAIIRVSKIVPDNCEIDLATNGTNLMRLTELECFDRISSIHISRHSVEDEKNRRLMNGPVPSSEELKGFIDRLSDPGKIVFNCVLQKDFVENCKCVAEYLDFAISLGVRNTSFITMFQANQYCEDHYLSAFMFPFVSDLGYVGWNNTHPDSQFDVWNRHSDHDYCHCLSGGYRNAEGRTSFYFRCPVIGENTPALCRQLVFTAENRLQDGFGDNRTVIWEF